MSNPTSNFGWQMPTSTDLVTDLPADFEVFGQAVDTDFVDLLGGTTGQILSKTSATDLDFTWISPTAGDIEGVTAGVGISGGGTSGTVTVTNDMATTITAAGDIVVGTGSGTYDNLPIGTTNQVLTADTTVSPYKVKWAAPAAGGYTLITDVALSSSTAYSFSSIPSTYKHLVLTWTGLVISANSSEFSLRFNADSASNYEQQSLYNETGGSPVLAGVQGTTAGPEMFGVHTTSTGNYTTARGSIIIYDYASTTRYKFYDANYSWYSNNNSRYNFFSVYGSYYSLSAISSLDITRISGTANITNQTNTSVRLYGVS